MSSVQTRSFCWRLTVMALQIASAILLQGLKMREQCDP
uniref:Uncharacterized protein n=1 Tax=Octopus bimaculoides TaxID=37653 RepID=A0A0L8I5R3_OCTBM